MGQNKKQKASPSFIQKFLQEDKLMVFGSVFFITSVFLLFGVFFSSSVRNFLHGSALATGLLPHQMATSEPLPVKIFKDVDSNNPNAEALNYLKKHHILNGYPDGTFKPNNVVTRAELLKLLFDAQEVSPTPAIYHSCFKDVKDDWFAPYVCYGEAKGLVRGYNDKTFGPDKTVTVIEALKIILLGYNVDLVQNSPSANMQIDEHAWFAQYVWTAYAQQLITWNHLQNPQQLLNLNQDTVGTALLTRGQLAEILYRIIK